MKIEEGKRYVRRDGTVTGPMVMARNRPGYLQDTAATTFVYWCSGNGKVFPGSNDEHPLDLMLEYDVDCDSAPDGYEEFRAVLDAALAQTSRGKGNDRHGNGKPFATQRIMSIARETGIGGHTYQICKKVQEAQNMHERGEHDAAQREILGAIVYCVAAHLLVEERK